MSVISKLLDLKPKSCSVVLTAAGSSSRMNGENKLFIELGGVPVIERTLSVLNSCSRVSEIVVVTRECDMMKISEICSSKGFDKVKKVILGGATRQESSYIGAMNCSRKAKYIAIHDAARPFIDHRLLEKTLDCAVRFGAAAPAVPLKDTVKVHKDNIVSSTPERDTLAAVQTPQIFDASIIKGALTKAMRSGVTYTDDCAAAEAMNMPIHLVEGKETNIKITTPWDVKVAELILKGETE